MNPKIIELMRKIRAAIDEAREILARASAENRALTENEAAREKELTSSVEEYKKRIAQEERLEEIEKEKGKEFVDKRGDAADTAAGQGWKDRGEFFSAIQRAGQRNPHFDERLIGQRTQLSGSDADGGFLVPQDIAREIHAHINDYSYLLSKITEVQVSGNGMDFPMLEQESQAKSAVFGGILAYWVGEEDAITASSAKFTNLSLKLKKVAAMVKVSDELQSDAIALSSWITQKVPYALAMAIEEGVLFGAGGNTPVGVANHASTVTISKEAGQAADTIEYDNIVKMFQSLFAPLWKSSIFVANQDTFYQLATMAQIVGAGGVPIFTPQNFNANLPFGSLMGVPLYFSAFSKTLGDKNDILLFDPKSYVMISKGGVRADSSIHVYFASDVSAFRFIKRLDGAPMWKNSMAAINGSNTVSMAVNIAERA